MDSGRKVVRLGGIEVRTLRSGVCGCLLYFEGVVGEEKSKLTLPNVMRGLLLIERIANTHHIEHFHSLRL